MALPPASAVFLKHLQRFPIRGIIVVLYVAADLGVNWYLRDDPPVSDRCSSDYPEFGESLESPLVASDGSVTDDLGRRFPPGQFWSEEDSVYGCPCSGEKPCIRKCCREYQSYNYSYSCVDSDYGFTELLEVVTVTDDELKYVNVTEDHFSVLSSECEVPHRLPAPYTLKYLNPTEDGTVLNVLFGSVFDQSEYCLETFVEGTVEGENEVFVVICLPTPEVREFRDRRLWQRNLVFYVLRVMSATINLVTLAVFCLLPQLRGGCGKSIMCYLIARIYCSLDDAIMTTKVIPTEDRLTCLIASPLALFSALSSRAWQLVIAYQIWSAFRPGSSRASDHGSTRQFLVYSAVAWGTPLATALVALAADQISGAPDFLAPRFAQEQCWFNSHDAHFFYYLVPYYAVELLVIVLCVATLWHLRTSRIGSEALQNAESRSHNVKDIKWSRLYAKTALVMGVNFALLPLVVILNQYYPLSRFINISILNIDDIRGAEIFLIFVLKRETLSELAQRLSCSQQTQPSRPVAMAQL